MIRAALATAALAAGSVSFNPPPTDGLDYEDAGRNCIALAVFTEARGEPLPGQIAVVEVIRARMQADGFPSYPCEVVAQLHQFHGFRDWPRGDAPTYPWDIDREAWETALRVTDGVMLEGWSSGCEDATHFYAGARPQWASSMRLVCRHGGHVFLAVVP